MLICLEVDVGKDEEFTINACGAGGQGKVDVKITSPSRRPIPCKVEAGASNEVHIAKYIPPEEGTYKVDISYDGNPVSGSPFTVEGVMPPDPSKVGVTNRRMRLICLPLHCLIQLNFHFFLLENICYPNLILLEVQTWHCKSFMDSFSSSGLQTKAGMMKLSILTETWNAF